MNRRKACFLSGAFLLGIAVDQFHQVALWALLALYCLAWARSIRNEKDTRAAYQAFWIAAMFLAVCGGIFNSRRAAEFRDLYEGRLKDGEQCLLQGEIYKRETDGDTRLFYLKNCEARLRRRNYKCDHVLLYLNAESYSIGEILSVEGTIQTFALPVNEGNYNERAYYQSMGVGFLVKGERALAASGKRSVAREGLRALREKLKESYQNSMPKEDSGVLLAMVLGDKGQMEKERKSQYQNAGISHFYSISGLHISMLGMALYRLLFRCGSGRLFSGILSAALILAYGEMTGFGISASRAIVMFLFLTYAKCRGKSYDRATALALSAAALAGGNPALLRNAGYWLSHAAVLGVILAEWLLKCGGAAEEEKKSRMRAMRENVRQALMTSACIQIVIIPVMGMFFYEISTYAALLNLIVLPCMGVLLGCGIFGGALGCVCPFAGKAALYPCHLILLLFECSCGFALKLPQSSFITGKPDVWTLLLWYGAVFAFVAARTRWRKAPASVLILPLGLLLLLPKSQAFEADILDVGQGDGIYICAPGANLFIDGGSSDVKGAGMYRILPFLKCRGVRCIDYWFVSHCDADHVSGLCEIIKEGYRIKNLVVSEYMPEDAAWEKLEGLASQARIPVLSMKKGDALRGTGGWSMTCLSFEGQSATEDRNENSLALFFESDALRIFLAGDIGMEQERALAAEWNLPHVDLYKASHHGSNNSNSEEILKSLRPEMTVISCGAKNRYGHPGEKALLRMRKAGGKIYETRRLGQIKIKGAGLEAEAFSVLK